MSEFAAGKKAFGFCDRCGFRYPLHELRNQTRDLRPTGWMVCPECDDEPQPQLQQGSFKIYDPIALRNPRPPLGQAASRRTSAWNPIGGRNSEFGPSDLENMYMTGEVGFIKVVIS